MLVYHVHVFPFPCHRRRLVPFTGGWQTNGVLTLTSGSPFTVYDTCEGSSPKRRADDQVRADDADVDLNPVTGNPDQGSRSSHPPASSAPTAGRETRGYLIGYWGQVGSNTGPAAVGSDFSVAKNIPVSESMRFQFRAPRERTGDPVRE